MAFMMPFNDGWLADDVFAIRLDRWWCFILLRHWLILIGHVHVFELTHEIIFIYITGHIYFIQRLYGLFHCFIYCCRWPFAILTLIIYCQRAGHYLQPCEGWACHACHYGHISFSAERRHYFCCHRIHFSLMPFRRPYWLLTLLPIIFIILISHCQPIFFFSRFLGWFSPFILLRLIATLRHWYYAWLLMPQSLPLIQYWYYTAPWYRLHLPFIFYFRHWLIDTVLLLAISLLLRFVTAFSLYFH